MTARQPKFKGPLGSVLREELERTQVQLQDASQSGDDAAAERDLELQREVLEKGLLATEHP